MARLVRVTIKLATRNLARHRGRSAIMLTALGLFLGLCIALEGIASGFYGSMREVAVGQTLGELQIHAPGHLPSRDPGARLDAGVDLADDIEAVEGVSVVAPRVRIAGMVAHDGDARGVDVIGASAAEREFGSIPERVEQGAFEIDEADAIVIGRGLAQTLELELGATLELALGESPPRSFTVAGVFASGNRQHDAQLVYVSLDAMRRALGLEGEALTEIALRTERGADLDELARRVGESCPDCEIRTWRELQPALAASMTTDHNFLRATFAVLVLVAGLMVLNLQLMSVYERTRELGMMLAIGATPRRLFWMLTIEAVCLGLLGVGLGVALGLAVLAALAGGIDVLALTGGESEIGGFSFAPRVYPQLGAGVALGMSLGALLVIVLAAMIPAVRLFGMSPLAALRSTGGSDGDA